MFFIFAIDSTIRLTFKTIDFLHFQGSEVHIQCDVAQCVGGCYEEVCPGDVLTASAIKNGRPGNKIEDGTMPAATTVFVLDPADAPRNLIFFEKFLSFASILK